MRLLILMLLLLDLSGGVVSAEPLVLQRTIALNGVSGRIDHMAIDERRKRLFVAELGNQTLDAIDLEAGQVIHRISGLKEPQGWVTRPRPKFWRSPMAEMGRCACSEEPTWRPSAW
jgi:hypothetical protein